MKVRVKEFKDKVSLRDYLLSLGNTSKGAEIISKKGRVYLFEIDGIDTRAANILKQDAISVGGDCAVPRKASSFEKGLWKVLLLVSERELERLAEKLKEQPFGLRELSNSLIRALGNYLKSEFTLTYRGKELLLKEPVVMGILNATPDSFSDGGRYTTVELALKRAEEIISQGGKIVDVGGESTRPGAPPVPLEEELRRVIPVIREVRKRLGEGFFISVDTYKAEVARQALLEGADMVNDISGLQFDPKMAEVVSSFGCPVVIMHIKGTPRDMQKNPYYEDAVSEICDYFEERLSFALERGIGRDKIILDPGIGFGKRLEDNLCILKRFSEFRVFGLPLLVGASRKSFIGAITGEDEPQERLAGSLGAIAPAFYGGAKIFRVHDVKETYQFLKLLRAVEEAGC
ncbi:dihydropteroate synthase [Thermovibrio sp.]